MDERDRERYTTAMIALGYATGFVSRMREELQRIGADAHDEDWAWLMKRVDRVMRLNDEADDAR